MQRLDLATIVGTFLYLNLAFVLTFDVDVDVLTFFSNYTLILHACMILLTVLVPGHTLVLLPIEKKKRKTNKQTKRTQVWCSQRCWCDLCERERGSDTAAILERGRARRRPKSRNRELVTHCRAGPSR